MRFGDCKIVGSSRPGEDIDPLYQRECVPACACRSAEMGNDQEKGKSSASTYDDTTPQKPLSKVLTGCGFNHHHQTY